VSEKAVIVTFKDKYAQQEIVELAEATGLTAVYVLPVKEIGIGKYGITSGKALELKDVVERYNPDIVIVDEQLTASQIYNLSKLVDRKVIDRIRLILDIFEKRAMTTEAKLQVKLAELQYEIPRLKELVRMRRMGEQTGPMGYGAYEIEKYMRFLKRQIVVLREKLEKERRRRELHRQKRYESNSFIVSLAGYTGAGKSTLFNRLSGENARITGKPFTTLTTTFRKVKGLDDVYVVDTVGFIERLPHFLIESFRSTLEELKYADLVLLVVDSSLPEEEFWRKYNASIKVLQELEIDLKNVIAVLNKVDARKYELKFQDERIAGYVEISALLGINIEGLLEKIKEKRAEKEQIIGSASSVSPDLSG